MKILIVGGGVGGLALAGCLRKRGIKNVTLIERAPEFHHIGFLIGLWGNGRAIMKYLGIDHITEKSGYEVSEESIKNKKGGLLKTFSLILGKKLDMTVTIPRADLHEGLLTLLSETNVRFNTTVKNIVQQEGNVEVTFSDDSKENFDLVVGADGTHSYVREKIFGTGFLKSYNWSVWAYWLPKNFKYPPQPTGLLGDGKSVFILPSHNSSTATFIARTDFNKGPNTSDHRVNLQKIFAEFGDFAVDVLKLAPDSSTIWHDEIMHVDIQLWYKDRVVLMGDAQHAVSPVVGMGSSMAMEDAYVLAEELSKNLNDIDLALYKYSERRKVRMKRFLKLVNRMDRWMRATGLLVFFRDYMTPFMPNSYFTGIIKTLLKEKI